MEDDASGQRRRAQVSVSSWPGCHLALQLGHATLLWYGNFCNRQSLAEALGTTGHDSSLLSKRSGERGTGRKASVRALPEVVAVAARVDAYKVVDDAARVDAYNANQLRQPCCACRGCASS